MEIKSRKQAILAKEEALDKLDDAYNLLVEAKYIIEDVISSDFDILSVKKTEIVELVANIIKLLSTISKKTNKKIDISVEGMYKVLYADYQKTLKEKEDLQKDVLALMKEKEWDSDTASLNLKLMRAERQIENQNASIRNKKLKIEDLKSEIRSLKRRLKDFDEE